MKQISVLLIDDDKNYSETLCDTLVLKGWHVDVASDGFEGISKVKERSYDAILLDLNLPGIDGIKTFEEIKKIRPDSTVFIVTGNDPGPVMNLLKQDIAAVMQKPLNIDNIFKSIASLDKKNTVMLELIEKKMSAEEIRVLLGHEIRNPLAAMINAIFLIKHDLEKMPNVDPKMFRRVEIVETEIKTASKVISNILDYARSTPPLFTDEDIVDIIKAVLLENKVKENIQVIGEFADVPKARVSREEIKQVVRNLMYNALDSMEDKGGTLTIVTSAADGGNKVCVEITDTGCGIPPELMEKVFEPFFSAKMKKGLGLGLSVVKKIVEQRHGGTMKILSQKDAGTSVFFELPLMKKQ